MLDSGGELELWHATSLFHGKSCIAGCGVMLYFRRVVLEHDAAMHKPKQQRTPCPLR